MDTTSWMKFRDEPIDRAWKAYFRHSNEYSPKQPLRDGVEVREHDRKQYVVMRNSYHTLAVYRIGNSGRLRRLNRWPADLDQW